MAPSTGSGQATSKGRGHRFTRLDDDAMRELVAAFELDELVAFEVIEAGTINSNFALSTRAGRYMLRVNEGKSREDVRYEAELVTELAARGVPTPVPLPARSGQRFHPYLDRFVSVFPWVEGRHLEHPRIEAVHTAALGEALAELHLAGIEIADRFAKESIYTTEAVVCRFEGFRDSTDPALGEAISAIAEEVSWLAENAPLRAAATAGIIHGDLFPDNVFYRGEELSALIDFEQASSGSLSYDLAVCLNAWCYEEDFSPELVRALVAGYRSRRDLTGDDREALFVELRAAAMRFLITRITDIHLAGQSGGKKDFRRYLRRLECWRGLGASGLQEWID